MKETSATQEKVIAVVLTHNRKELLQQTLAGLFAQSRKVDRIVIIDSVSTDGTHDTLKEKGILDRTGVRYVHLDENRGASGGFGFGMPFAIEEGADWVWILDDDIVPQDDCLELLLTYKEISHCLCPNREGKTVPFLNPAVGLTTHSKMLTYANGKELVFTNTGSFEGMLIHKDVIDQIGFPDKRFFLVSGDMVYGFTASLYTNVLHVKKAFIKRLLPERKALSSKRAYLFIRNQFLVKEYLQKYNLFQGSFFHAILTLLVVYYCTVNTVKSRNLGMPFAVLKGVIHGSTGRFGPPK